MALEPRIFSRPESYPLPFIPIFTTKIFTRRHVPVIRIFCLIPRINFPMLHLRDTDDIFRRINHSSRIAIFLDGGLLDNMMPIITRPRAFRIVPQFTQAFRSIQIRYNRWPRFIEPRRLLDLVDDSARLYSRLDHGNSNRLGDCGTLGRSRWPSSRNSLEGRPIRSAAFFWVGTPRQSSFQHPRPSTVRLRCFPLPARAAGRAGISAGRYRTPTLRPIPASQNAANPVARNCARPGAPSTSARAQDILF